MPEHRRRQMLKEAMTTEKLVQMRGTSDTIHTTIVDFMDLTHVDLLDPISIPFQGYR